LKGVILASLNRSEEAIDAFGNATKIDPKFAEAWNNMGLMLNDAGRYEEAVKAFDNAIAAKGSA